MTYAQDDINELFTLSCRPIRDRSVLNYRGVRSERNTP